MSKMTIKLCKQTQLVMSFEIDSDDYRTEVEYLKHQDQLYKRSYWGNAEACYIMVDKICTLEDFGLEL